MLNRYLYLRPSRIKQLVTLHTLFLLLSIMIISPVQARWSSYEDVDFETEFYNRSVEVNADGTTNEVVEIQYKILREAGRDIAANYNLTYNEQNTNMKVLEAKTITEDKEYRVRAEDMEDKPLASSPLGFDQHRQILISYPNVQIGSKIYLRYTEREIKPVVENFFGTNLYFGLGSYWKASHVTISSKLPLNLQINDPENALKIVNSTKGDLYLLDITLSKPITHLVSSEPSGNIIDERYLTWVSLSSLDSWEELGRRLSPAYVQAINQPLPKAWQEIVNAAKSKKDEVEQINTVTSLLNDKIRYMGDWRTVKGKYFPRDLEQIATSQLGDCKDFTVAAGAILQQLGYQAHAALVLRGIPNPSVETKPILSRFNHAFLKVISKTGRIFWLDPTNFSSMAGGMYPDIADKPTLVLDDKQSSYERTADIDLVKSQTHVVEQLVLQGTTVQHTGEFVLRGEKAARFTGAGLYISADQIRDVLFRQLSGTYLESRDIRDFTLPDLKSRIVKDLTFKYSYDHRNKVFKTNLGPAISLDYSSYNQFTKVAPDQVCDVYIGPVGTFSGQTIIKDTLIKQGETLNIAVSSPWVDITRSCTLQGADTRIDDLLVIKKNFIRREDLLTPEFKNLKEVLEVHFKNSIIVLPPAS